MNNQIFYEKDALGNNIVVGNMYGYSTEKSGYSHITIGRAFKVTKTGLISIERLYTKRNAGSVREDLINRVAVNSYRLFPVDPNSINVCQ